jgi:alkylation response protein AidB-like acyl-CoA dehydrogenase
MNFSKILDAFAKQIMTAAKITSPDSPALGELCDSLAEMAQEVDLTGQWPARQLALCGEAGVFEWFLDPRWGGQAWDEESVVRGYLALSSACLTTTFIITQRSGACQRITTSDNEQLKARLLPDLARGDSFATVGVSHLTTSRRHLTRPVLRATRAASGYVLDGFSPWVTGGDRAQHVVVGATVMEGDEPTEKQLLVALPTDLPGVSAPEPARLVGVSASRTGEFRLDSVTVDDQWVIAGPVENIMSLGRGGGTGSHQTSTLALGLSRAAIDFIEDEATRREDLQPPLDAQRQECDEVTEAMFTLVRGEQSACSTEQLRQQANSLVLRSTQAALAAAKGTGYVRGHPAGRWCREALFFLVWSCPQPVVSANLCELAGISE